MFCVCQRVSQNIEQQCYCSDSNKSFEWHACCFCKGSQQLELQSADSVYRCVFLWVETEVLLQNFVTTQFSPLNQQQQQQPHHYMWRTLSIIWVSWYQVPHVVRSTLFQPVYITSQGKCWIS